MTIKQVCTIAGTDSGGGAGIQADIKTFQERGVFGTSIIVAVTAQNTLGVTDIATLPTDNVSAQLEAVFSDFTISAVKTGMLVDQSYIQLVADFLKMYPEIPLVVDPVMVAKGGSSLISETAVERLKSELLPLGTLVTPNLPEAERLTNSAIRDKSSLMAAAKKIQALGCKNVLIKGGHGANQDKAIDYLLLENGESVWLSGLRYQTQNTHGTGCTLSACIAAEIGKGKTVSAAVELGKKFIEAAIKEDLKIGHGQGPTNHWAYGKLVEEKNYE